jgi:hypothetical protein
VSRCHAWCVYQHHNNNPKEQPMSMAKTNAGLKSRVKKPPTHAARGITTNDLMVTVTDDGDFKFTTASYHQKDDGTPYYKTHALVTVAPATARSLARWLAKQTEGK